MLSKIQDGTSDELTKQLRMFEKETSKPKTVTLLFRDSQQLQDQNEQNKDKLFKFIKKSYKGDICNYCNRKGHRKDVKKLQEMDF